MAAALRTRDEIEAADAARGDGRSNDAGGDDDERDKRRARRPSTTDPQARVMKMEPKTRQGCGRRPAVNVQCATDVASGVVLGVDVANRGNAPPHLTQMVDQLADRCGTAAGAWLADGGVVSLAAVTDLADRGIAFHAPPPERRGNRPAGPRPRSPADARPRSRSGTPSPAISPA